MNILALIPARGASKGLPDKNLRPFAGLPLIEHSIRLASLCPEIARCVVSTDSPRIAEAAKAAGADVPFLRPAALAQDDTPLWPVLQHALAQVEAAGGRFDAVLLLDPTSPTRLPEDVAEASRRLAAAPAADGIVAVAEPDFNPVWHSVVEKDGLMADLLPEGGAYNARQQAPRVLHITGLLYLWRARFVRESPAWRNAGKHLMLELPERRSCSIDTLDQFERAEALIKAGLVDLPWLKEKSRP